MNSIAGIEWDDGNWPKCGKHGVTRAQIEAILAASPFVLLDPSHQEIELRYNAVGQTPSGRNVFLVFTLRERDGGTVIRPIGARFMHTKEVERYVATRG